MNKYFKYYPGNPPPLDKDSNNFRTAKYKALYHTRLTQIASKPRRTETVVTIHSVSAGCVVQTTIVCTVVNI